MNNLLFTALLIALFYYFFFALPNQKKLTNSHPLNNPLTHSQFTQTEPDPKEKELAELKKENQALAQDYQTRIKEKDSQITKLQSEMRELVKRPEKPTNSKTTQTDSEEDLTNTFDTLIKNIQELNNSLD